MTTGNRLILNGDDLAGSAIDTDCYSMEIVTPPPEGFSLIYKFNKAGVGSADLVAVLVLQAWNGSVIGWVTCTDEAGVAIAFPSDPAGSLMSDEVTFYNTRAAKYRVMVDVTSGDGSGEIELAV